MLNLPITTNKMEPYTRKLLYIILASFVKSPNIDNHGAIYVCWSSGEKNCTNKKIRSNYC